MRHHNASSLTCQRTSLALSLSIVADQRLAAGGAAAGDLTHAAVSKENGLYLESGEDPHNFFVIVERH